MLDLPYCGGVRRFNQMGVTFFGMMGAQVKTKEFRFQSGHHQFVHWNVTSVKLQAHYLYVFIVKRALVILTDLLHF